MSRFNKNSFGRHSTVNYEGDKAYLLGKKMELYSLVCTSTLNDKFYVSSQTEYNRFLKLVHGIMSGDPGFIGRLAIYTRRKMYLRTMPGMLAVELALGRGGARVKEVVAEVIQRPDEIVEMLSYYIFRTGRTDKEKKLDKLPSQIKKGIRAVFESRRFNEYQYAKYNRKTDVRFADALRLTHPRPVKEDETVDHELNDLFKKITKNELRTPDTWEVAISEIGKKKYETETEKNNAFRDEWERLIMGGKLGYMATLRNLRNFLVRGVGEKYLKMVAGHISDEGSVLKSKQLPFRFLSAYMTVYNTGNTKAIPLLAALEKAAKISVQNLDYFSDERCLIACDVSGSMNNPLSPRSEVMYSHVGLLLGQLLRTKIPNSVLSIFGQKFAVKLLGNENVLATANHLAGTACREVGHSTNGHLALEWAIRNNEVFDKIFFFTDCQFWHDDDGNGIGLAPYWQKYKSEINPNAKVYFLDLAGYGTTPLGIKNNDVYLISGWSDKIFDMLSALESGDALEEIEATSL